MLAQNVVPVVLCLPRVLDPPLREIRARSNTQTVIEDHISECIRKVFVPRLQRIASGISSEVNAQTAERNPCLVHHVSRKIVGPTHQCVLAKVRDVGPPSSYRAVGGVEKEAAVKKIAAGDGVAIQLQVSSYYSVVSMRRCWQGTRDPTELHISTYRSFIDVCEQPGNAIRKRSWVAGLKRIGPILIEAGKGIRIEAGRARHQLR